MIVLALCATLIAAFTLAAVSMLVSFETERKTVRAPIF